MASWSSIVQEVQNLNRPDAYDTVRRQKMDRVRQLTGRDLIIYAADFTTNNPLKMQALGSMMPIILNDKDGFEEVTRNIQGSNACVDILLHSPGGSAEATESIVELLRERFSDIRFIIPNIAKSAATMMAMSGNQLLIDERSELGPIDPQMLIPRDNQLIAAPAQAIKDQFKVAQAEISADTANLPSWLPILREYGPSLLAQCDNHLKLAEELVSKWLEKYMFADDPERAEKANRVAQYLNNHNYFRSHGRRVGITDLQGLGLNILDMRTEPELHEAVRDLYTALMLTFQNTGATKVFENSRHEAIMILIQVQQSKPEQHQPTRPLTQQQRDKNRAGSSKEGRK